MNGAGSAHPSTRNRLARLIDARRLWRTAFWAYAVIVFTATHWPAWEFQVPLVERPDLIVHFAAFAAWCALFTLAGFFKPPFSARNIALSALAAAAYAALDEGSQAIPFVRRNAAWDDWFANLGGVAIGAIGCLALFAFARPSTGQR